LSQPLELVWRDQWGRLLALLVAQFRRLDLAEDGLAEAFESAVRTWEVDGVPDNPAAWLLTTARRRVLDRLRAEATAARKEPMLVVEQEVSQRAARVMADPGGLLDDERLRLVFLCAHPALERESASALTLRLVLGVATEDVARLFLVSRPTMAARLTRAKRRLAATGAPFRVPDRQHLPDRLATVADVVYLAFTAGYAPGSGPDVVRTELAGEAVRLTRVLRELLPGEPVLDLLLALMLLQHSRRGARTDEQGRPVLLADQDRGRWRSDEIEEALNLLAPHVGTRAAGREGSYLLQALVAAEHATAPTSAATRWDRIAGWYAQLEALTGSPVVRLNRAVAAAEANGPTAGLRLLEGLDDALPGSHRVPAVRGELLARQGDTSGARTAYELAISRCGNTAEREHLREKLTQLTGAERR
jgi:RNA polymerase sigma-70 factor (ECF subfamily)